MPEGAEIRIIGGGLAGGEAAWQAARRGVKVRLYEMKPLRFSPAHHSACLGELVCSNSFRASKTDAAVGLLKEEMRLLDSLIMRVADATAVPAGAALAVDRQRFAALLTQTLEQHPLIAIERQEIHELPPASPQQPLIVAAGPLMSEDLTASLQQLTGETQLAFYDAIAPIVDAETVDRSIVYSKSRWRDDEPGDYLNCPMNREQYAHFIELLDKGQCVAPHAFESVRYFEGCLPIEVMCRRGPETLRFGPMKPVGLAHPETGDKPYAVVQLRAENLERSAYNLVGFQTKLLYSEQERIFRAIPGLEQALFLRLGSMHRNTFVRAPAVLTPSLQLKHAPGIFIAGQLSGVEGYVESAATGLLAGLHAATMLTGQTIALPPRETAHGALMAHLIESRADDFQPSNINFGLFPLLREKIPRKLRAARRAEAALKLIEDWKRQLTC